MKRWIFSLLAAVLTVWFDGNLMRKMGRMMSWVDGPMAEGVDEVEKGRGRGDESQARWRMIADEWIFSLRYSCLPACLPFVTHPACIQAVQTHSERRASKAQMADRQTDPILLFCCVCDSQTLRERPKAQRDSRHVTHPARDVMNVSCDLGG